MADSSKSENPAVAELLKEFENVPAYTSFAVVAEQEGYEDVAFLFAAIARSEQILARLAAECLPEVSWARNRIHMTAKAGSTAENLKTTIFWSAHALEGLYPHSLSAANGPGCTALGQFVRNAVDVVEEQLRISRTALDKLQSTEPGACLSRACQPQRSLKLRAQLSPTSVGLPWFWMRGFENSIPVRIAARTPYFVCSKCGYATDVRIHQHCNGCSATVCCGCVCSRALRMRISNRKRFATTQIL